MIINMKHSETTRVKILVVSLTDVYINSCIAYKNIFATIGIITKNTLNKVDPLISSLLLKCLTINTIKKTIILEPIAPCI